MHLAWLVLVASRLSLVPSFLPPVPYDWTNGLWRPMRILLLRSPRYVWPFNSETSAFWQPLGLLCLAAAVRRDLPGAQVEVWDCPGEKCGWKTLEARLAARRIDVLGVGEETVSAHEAIRAAQLVKRLWPDCTVVAGGVYFAHAI